MYYEGYMCVTETFLIFHENPFGSGTIRRRVLLPISNTNNNPLKYATEAKTRKEKNLTLKRGSFNNHLKV